MINLIPDSDIGIASNSTLRSIAKGFIKLTRGESCTPYFSSAITGLVCTGTLILVDTIVSPWFIPAAKGAKTFLLNSQLGAEAACDITQGFTPHTCTSVN